MSRFLVRRDGTGVGNFSYHVDLPKTVGEICIRLTERESGGFTAVVFSYRTYAVEYECEVYASIPMVAVWDVVRAYLDCELEALKENITRDCECFTENNPMEFYFKEMGERQYKCIRTIAKIKVGTVVTFEDTQVCVGDKVYKYHSSHNAWTDIEDFVDDLLKGRVV